MRDWIELIVRKQHNWIGLQHLQSGRTEMFARHHNVASNDFVIEEMSVHGWMMYR